MNIGNLIIPFDRARRVASNELCFIRGSSRGANRQIEYGSQTWFPGFGVFWSLKFYFILMKYIPFDRAHRALSGTLHSKLGTFDSANRSGINSNPALTSLTFKKVHFSLEAIR